MPPNVFLPPIESSPRPGIPPCGPLVSKPHVKLGQEVIGKRIQVRRGSGAWREATVDDFDVFSSRHKLRLTDFEEWVLLESLEFTYVDAASVHNGGPPDSYTAVGPRHEAGARSSKNDHHGAKPALANHIIERESQLGATHSARSPSSELSCQTSTHETSTGPNLQVNLEVGSKTAPSAHAGLKDASLWGPCWTPNLKRKGSLMIDIRDDEEISDCSCKRPCSFPESLAFGSPVDVEYRPFDVESSPFLLKSRPVPGQSNPDDESECTTWTPVSRSLHTAPEPTALLIRPAPAPSPLSCASRRPGGASLALPPLPSSAQKGSTCKTLSSSSPPVMHAEPWMTAPETIARNQQASKGTPATSLTSSKKSSCGTSKLKRVAFAMTPDICNAAECTPNNSLWPGLSSRLESFKQDNISAAEQELMDSLHRRLQVLNSISLYLDSVEGNI